MPSPLFSFRFPKKTLGVVFAALVLAGCSSPHPPGYYDVPHDTPEADAQQKAQGRSTAQAPSQIQFGFDGGDQPQQQPQTSTAVSSLPAAVSKAKTFLGTVPCLTAGGNCPAQRITLTIAPTGEWRARTQYLDATAAETPLVQQGCWLITGNDPLRIMLQTKEGVTKGTFTFLNNNVMRVASLNDITPNLDYRLTEQADVDPISELPTGTPLPCPRP